MRFPPDGLDSVGIWGAQVAISAETKRLFGIWVSGVREATLAERENADTWTSRAEGGSSPGRGSGRGSAGRSRSGRGDRPVRPRRYGRRRRKVCRFCVDKVEAIDYKDVSLLRQCVNERGRIMARRRTGTCARHQRMLARAIKRARHIALLPYTAEHVRLFGT